MHERLENQRIEIERLRDCLRDCADELEAQLDVRHVHRDRYPTIMRDYERDMEPVKRARALLPSVKAAYRTEPQVAELWRHNRIGAHRQKPTK